jgi:hypothetical protein
MDLSISHEVADFIDYVSRLLGRLKIYGKQLSAAERRILSVQLRQLSIAIKELDETTLRHRAKEAA